MKGWVVLLLLLVTLAIYAHVTHSVLSLPFYAEWLSDWLRLQQHIEGQVLIEYSVKGDQPIEPAVARRLTIPVRADLLTLDDLTHTASQWSVSWISTIQDWWENIKQQDMHPIEWIFGVDHQKDVGKLYCAFDNSITALECDSKGELNWKHYHGSLSSAGLYDYAFRMTSEHEPLRSSVHYRLTTPIVHANQYAEYWHSFSGQPGQPLIKTTYFRKV